MFAAFERNVAQRNKKSTCTLQVDTRKLRKFESLRLQLIK